MAGRSGLTIWLSATPRNRTEKRHSTTRVASLGRGMGAVLFEVLDAEPLGGAVGEVDDRSRGHSHRDRDRLADLFGARAELLGLLDVPVQTPLAAEAERGRDGDQLLGFAVDLRRPVGRLVELEVDLLHSIFDHGVARPTRLRLRRGLVLRI